MKRIILGISLFLFLVKLQGQIISLSDHYLNNTLSFNPAYAGCDDALSVTLLYRNQWVGFDDAPRYSSLPVHTPVRSDRIGLGLILENNSYGINRETSLAGNYAYRMEVHNGILAFGLGFGATVKYVAWNELNAADENDILLMNNPESAVLPDFSLGVYYYNKNYFIGFSLPMLLTHEINPNTGNYSVKNDFSEYNYFLEGGYYIGISKNLKFLPSCLVRYHPGYAPEFDINGQVIFSERIWAGLGYRNSQTILGLLQLQLNRQIMVAYSYSFDTGEMGQNSNGSHEVVINYLFSYSRKVTSPRQY